MPDVPHETAAHDRLVVAVRADHPLAHAELTLDRYAAAVTTSQPWAAAVTAAAPPGRRPK